MAIDWDYDHIGIVVRDLDAAIKHYRRMGLELLKPPEAGSIEAASTPIQLNVCFIQNQAIRIKLIQPTGDDNLYSEYINKCGEGIQQIEFHVDDLQKEKNRLADLGIGVLATSRRPDGSEMEILFDTRKVGNVSMALFSEPSPFIVFKPQEGAWKFWHVGFQVKNIREFLDYYQQIGFRLLAPPRLGSPTQTVMDRWMRYNFKKSPYGRTPIANGANRHWMSHLQNHQGTFLMTGGATERLDEHSEFLNTHGEGIDHIHFLVNDLPKELANMVSSGFPVVSTQKRADGKIQESFYDTREVGNVAIALWAGAPSVKTVSPGLDDGKEKEMEQKFYEYYDNVEGKR